MIRDQNYWSQEVKDKKAFERGQSDSFHLRDPIDVRFVYKTKSERENYMTGYDSVMDFKRYA
jgi:hypothetical protein